MIPYFEVQNFHLGSITIQTWGLMVALGFLFGAFASVWLAKKRGLEPKIVWDSLTWIIVGALIGARLIHVIFYEPAYFAGNPLEIIAIWNGGLSSVGGFIGALIGGITVLKRKGVNMWRYADVMVFGLPLGLFIGRIGCFLKHLHPGTPTDFFPGVRYPDGIVRHDLGLYLSLNGLLLFLVFLIMFKRGISEKVFIMTFLLWYGTSRFALDFLRAYDGPIVDARYLGLTPAQYVSIMMIFAGLYLFYFTDSRMNRHSQKTRSS